MVRSATITDQLARAYREARVLVLGDRTPKVDRAFALHREFLAIRASFTEEQDGAISEWETTFLERTRRAVIVALRHQAIAIRDRWSENKSSFGIEQPSPHVDLEHALQLSTAAQQLHVNDDSDASRTAQVMEFLRRSIAQEKATAPPLPAPDASPRPEISTIPETSDLPAASILPATTDAAATPSDLDATPAAPVVASPRASIRPAKVEEIFRSILSKVAQARRPALSRLPRLPLFTAAGFVLVIGIASVIVWIGKIGPVANGGVEKGPASSTVTEARAPLPTPGTARVAAILLKSDPSGARVTVGGEFRGETPLSLEGKSGDHLSIVMRKGSRVWRGTLTVGEDAQQIVTIRLPVPKLAQTPRPQPTAPQRSGQGHFEAAMRDGIELYKGGWYGPAAGRFREAVTIDPRSPQAYLWLGRALMRSDRQAEARRALEKVIELEPTGPEADEAAMSLSKLP